MSIAEVLTNAKQWHVECTDVLACQRTGRWYVGLELNPKFAGGLAPSLEHARARHPQGEEGER